MRHHDVDVAVIGAGTAGLVARRTAAGEGASTVIIDPGPFGTTCARVGCMPSKLLIAAADVAHDVRHADVFGVQVGGVRVDGTSVLERVRSERDRFVGFVLRSVEQLQEEGVLIRGRARFVDANTLVVTDAQGDDVAEVHARSFVVAVGGHPFVPPTYRSVRDVCVTTDEVFELPTLPKKLLVAGSGVIGLELGQAMARLGVDTTMIGVGQRIGPLSDPVVMAEARRLIGLSMPIHPTALHAVVERADGGARVSFPDSAGRPVEAVYDRILLAAGRRTNLAGLGLDAAGIEVGDTGLVAFDKHTMRVGDSHIYVAGDANQDRPLLHEAADEGRIAGLNAARHPEPWAQDRRTPLAVVFTAPQMAVVGTPFAGLTPGRFACGEIDYSDQGRSRVMNQHAGVVRIYGERGSGKLLGAEMLGPRVEHTAHLLAWAIQSEMSVARALEMPFYHPVVEEGIRTALRDLEVRLDLDLPCGDPCQEVGPGG